MKTLFLAYPVLLALPCMVLATQPLAIHALRVWQVESGVDIDRTMIPGLHIF